MNLLRKKYKHVVDLRGFLRSRRVQVLVDVSQKAALDLALEYIVAYDDVKLIDPPSQPQQPFMEWLESTLASINSTVIGRPAPGGTLPLSYKVFMDNFDMWQAFDAQVGRPLMHFLVYDAALFTRHSKAPLQLTGRDKLSRPAGTRSYPRSNPQAQYVQKCSQTVDYDIDSLLVHDTFDISGYNEVMARHLSRLFRGHRQKTRMVPSHLVSNYCLSCLKALLPQRAFGRQWPLLRRKIHHYIQLPQRSRFYVQNMASGFAITQTWVGPSCNKVDMQRKQLLFRQFIQWVFLVVTHVLLRPFTLRSTGNYKDDYWFLRSRWREIEASQNAEFIASLESWPPAAACDNPVTMKPARAYVVPKPKPGAFRHLINLKSLKSELFNVNQVLRLEAAKACETPHLATPTAFYPALEEYLQNNQGPFYVVKTDITGCYDNANTAKLWRVLETRLLESEHEVRTYNFLTDNRQKQVSLANAVGKLPRFDPPVPAVYQEKPRAGIFLPTVHVMNVLKLVLNQLAVDVDGSAYTKNYGIPQGSSISVALCDLMCQDFIRKELEPFWACSKSLLLRYVDDFLFITTDYQKARRYTAALRFGHPKYGLEYSMHKTQCNFGPDAKHHLSFIGIPLGVEGTVSCIPRLGLDKVHSCLRACVRDDLRMHYGSRPLSINLKVIPRDAYQQVVFGRGHFPEAARVNLEKLLEMKFHKLCACLRAFRHRRMQRSYLERVVSAAIKELCRLLLRLGVPFKAARKLVIKYAQLLRRRSHLSTSVVHFAVPVWLSLYKNRG